MELKVTKEQKQPLLKRIYVEAELQFPGKATPSNADVAKALSDRMSSAADAVVVRHIFTDFGKNAACVEAFVYESKALLDSTEAKHKDKKAAPAPAPAS